MVWQSQKCVKRRTGDLPSAGVIAVSWKQLPGLQPAARVLVRDVWSKRDAGIHQDGFSITVPADGT